MEETHEDVSAARVVEPKENDGDWMGLSQGGDLAEVEVEGHKNFNAREPLLQ